MVIERSLLCGHCAPVVEARTGIPADKYLRDAVAHGMSARQIAREIGTSHVTISRMLKELGATHQNGWAQPVV